MPSSRPGSAGSRGPVRREPRAAPTGYRITDRVRFELKMAEPFTGTWSLQAVIDLAVTEFLDRIKAVEGFNEALVNAEREQRRRAGIAELDHRDGPPGN